MELNTPSVEQIAKGGLWGRAPKAVRGLELPKRAKDATEPFAETAQAKLGLAGKKGKNPRRWN
jgi:hypothetical protein